jgi:hypothetical protein
MSSMKLQSAREGETIEQVKNAVKTEERFSDASEIVSAFQ